MLGKLLTWLIRRLFGLRYHYFELRDGKYLKVKRGAAEIIDLEDVPESYRIEPGDLSDLHLVALENIHLARKLAPATRLSILKQLHPFAVLEKARQNSVIERDVLRNPALVDADSPFEAQLKLDLVDGKDISPRIEADESVSESDVEKMLDTDFLVKWGYNQYGEALPEKLATGKGDAGTSANSTRTSSEHTDGDSAASDRRQRIPRATPQAAQASTGSKADTSATKESTSETRGNTAADGNSAAGGNRA